MLTGNATGLSGTPDITVRNVTGVAATFTGVLTYDDVTNVDSLGIVTARSGVEFGASGVGGTITATGQAEFAGNCHSITWCKCFRYRYCRIISRFWCKPN